MVEAFLVQNIVPNKYRGNETRLEAQPRQRRFDT